MIINLGEFDHDLTVLPSPGIMVNFREIIPIYGRTIQVSELLQFTQSYYHYEWLLLLLHQELPLLMTTYQYVWNEPINGQSRNRFIEDTYHI